MTDDLTERRYGYPSGMRKTSPPPAQVPQLETYAAPP
jgi:hypothetical protein